MNYRHARTSTYGRSMETQIDPRTCARAAKVFRKTACGTQSDCFECELARTGVERAGAVTRGVKMGRRPKLTSRRVNEAFGRKEGGEPMRESARSDNIYNNMISRLAI